MRWKLMFIASIPAAVVGALGAMIMFSQLMNVPLSEPLFTLLTSPLSGIIIVVPAALAAAIFVYRHTARRRKLQALFTALLSIFLAVVIYFIAGYFLAAKSRAAGQPRLSQSGDYLSGPARRLC